MAIPHIMPLGFNHRRADDGAIIMLNNPQGSQTLELGTPVTLWRYSPGRLAVAKVRGDVSAVGYVTATSLFAVHRPAPANFRSRRRACSSSKATRRPNSAS